MARKKLKLAYITDATARRQSFMHRKKGVIKKLDEITTLCDVEACAVIYDPANPNPEMWPSQPDVANLIEKFEKCKVENQAHKSMTHEDFLEAYIAKLEKKNKKMVEVNNENCLKEVMFQCLGGNMNDFHMDNTERHELCKYIDKYLKVLLHHRDVTLNDNPDFETGESSSMAVAPDMTPIHVSELMAPTNIATNMPPPTLALEPMAPTNIGTNMAPTLTPSLMAPTNMALTLAPALMAPTNMSTNMPPTLAPALMAPTNISTNMAPTLAPALMAPTNMAPTLAPALMAPTNIVTNMAPIPVHALMAPTTMDEGGSSSFLNIPSFESTRLIKQLQRMVFSGQEQEQVNSLATNLLPNNDQPIIQGPEHFNYLARPFFPENNQEVYNPVMDQNGFYNPNQKENQPMGFVEQMMSYADQTGFPWMEENNPYNHN